MRNEEFYRQEARKTLWAALTNPTNWCIWAVVGVAGLGIGWWLGSL